jgi:hypothetical protein
MPGWSAASEEELNSQRDYTLLPEDEYIAKVTSVEIKKDQANKFPSKGDMDPTHDMIVLKAEVLSFADGEPLVDDAGNPVEDEVISFQAWLNPKKVGLVPQIAKTRKAFAAILGQPVGERINIGDLNELVGKTFIVALKPNNGYNNAYDFRPHKRVRTRGTTARGPVEGIDLMEKAKEIYDEDSPTNRSPAPDVTAVVSDDLDF